MEITDKEFKDAYLIYKIWDTKDKSFVEKKYIVDLKNGSNI